MQLPIVTGNLIIDEFRNSDYSRLRDIAVNINNKADQKNGYMPFYAFQVDKEEEDRKKKISQKVAQFILKCDKERKEEPRVTYRLAIRKKDSKELIGNVTINMLPVEEHGQLVYGDRGCFLDPNFAKNGYAVEATRAVTHQFFQKYDEMDVTAHPDNAHSRKLIERSGGKQVGLRESSEYGHGEPRAVFKIKKDDFYRACAFSTHAPNLLSALFENAVQREEAEKAAAQRTNMVELKPEKPRRDFKSFVPKLLAFNNKRAIGGVECQGLILSAYMNREQY